MNEVQHTAPVKDHRGRMLLVFGILGTPLWIFGAVAWVLGNRDLKAMAEGKLDSNGEGLTMAGKILGIIGLFMNLLWIAKKIVIDGVGNVGPLPPH